MVNFRSKWIFALLLSLVLVTWAPAQDSAELAQEYQARLAELAPDAVEAHLELAVWCEENGLEKEAKSLYDRVIQIDPDNRQARLKLRFHRVPPGRWLSEDEYREFRGDVFIDGKWLTSQQWRTLVTSEARRKISPWPEVTDGLRVDTQHFVILTDGDEGFANDISEIVELTFMEFIDLMDCREVIMPPEVAGIGGGVDLSDATFLNLVEDAGARFGLAGGWELTCWTSGAMRMRFPNGKEILRGLGGATMMKGLDGRDRLVRPFMTADNRIVVEAFRSRDKWIRLRYEGESTGARKRLPMTGERVLLWRALREGDSPAQAMQITDQVGYYLAFHCARLFAPKAPLWFTHGMGEYFERGTGFRNRINLKRYDKGAFLSAKSRLSRSGLMPHFNDIPIYKAQGGDRMTSMSKIRFPVLYAFVCYSAQRRASTGQQGGGTVLEEVYRRLARGESAKAAVEKGSGQDIASFENDMIKWLDRYTPSGRSRGR